MNKISKNRTTALIEIFSGKPNLLIGDGLPDFLSSYFLCEALVRKLIEYFDIDNPVKLTIPKERKCLVCGVDLKIPGLKIKRNKFKTLNVGKIKKSLAYFEIDFPLSDVDFIFKGGDGISGQRSARQLRNLYAHSLSGCAKKEILERRSNLLDLMDKFCQLINKKVLIEN